MRFMMMVMANNESEAGVMPTEQELSEMGTYNEQLVNAGVMLAGDGLHPTSKGARVRFEGDKRTVIDGPFTETKELLAGFWIIDVKSKDEALAWAKRIPFREGHVEVRQVFETEDFTEISPEEVARELALRERIESQAAQR